MPYYQTFADIVKQFGPNKKDIAVLNLGGGGYLFPRYLKKEWPAGRIDVVEIDPEITKAAIRAFGLPEDPPFRIHHMDARNYIEDLTRKKRSGETIPLYDFIFCDVFTGGLAVPFHLTTYEFNEKVAGLLAPQGLYVINLVDTNISTRRPFLASVVNTMKKTFPYTYALWPSKKGGLGKHGTIKHKIYVVIGSREELDKTRFELPGFNSRLLSRADLASLENTSKGMVLTDDYAPVNNLLLDAFRTQGEKKHLVYF